MDDRTAERMARNEARFREINRRLEGDIRPLADPAERIPFVCECSDAGCRETIGLRMAEFDEVRAREGQFAVVPGHQQPEIERVVREAGHYLVVEKFDSAT